jgi:hypothetical protein
VATYAAAIVTLGLALYAVWVISLVVSRPEQAEERVTALPGTRAERRAPVLSKV